MPEPNHPRHDSATTPWLLVAVALGGIGLAALLLQRPALAALMILGPWAALPLLRRPGFGLGLLVGLLLVEGALRKWMFPGLAQPIYFLKDLLLLGLLAAWAMERLQSGAGKPDVPAPLHGLLRASLLLVLAWLALQIFNPRLPSLGLYAFGLRTYLLPLSLLLLVPWALQRDGFRRIQTGFLFAAAPLLLLAWIQTMVSPLHPLNRYVEESMHIATFGGRQPVVRATSTFSYISGYATYLQVAGLALVHVFLTGARIRPVLAALSLLGVVAGLLLNGSRAPMLFTLASLPLVSLPVWRRYAPRTWIRPVLLLLIVGLLGQIWLAEPAQRFQSRVEANQDGGERLERIILGPFRVAPEAGLLGWGPGSMHQSRDALLQRTGDATTLPDIPEEESMRIVLELGLPGATLWMLLRVALLLQLWQWFRQGRRRRDDAAAVTALVPFVLLLQTLISSLLLNITLYLLIMLWAGGARLYASIPPDETGTVFPDDRTSAQATPQDSRPSTAATP